MAQTDDNNSPSEEVRSGPLFRFGTGDIANIMNEGLDLNMVWILETLARKELSIDIIPSSKFSSWVQTLKRKQFLTEAGTVSTKGAALLAQLGATVPGLSTYMPTVDMFNIWWSSYPPTATFTYRGVSFTSSQVKRIKKTLCRRAWDEILLEGEYTADQIVNGTRNHIAMAMEESVKNKENRVHFIFNSERYIRERCFAPYIETVEAQVNHDTIDI